MTRLAVFALVIAASTGTPADAQKRSPQEAAKAFSLDPGSLSSDPTAPPSAAVTSSPASDDASATAPTTVEPPDTANAPIVTTLGPAPSLDTPIARLIADPRARAVLDKDLPGLSTDENLIHFQNKSLRQFQPLTGGQLTPALLAKVGADLAALDEKETTTLVPVASPRKGRRNDRDSGR